MAYDILMMCTIVISVLPLAFKGTNAFFRCIDIVTAIVFIIDYALRLATADYKLRRTGVVPFLRYPFTPWAIIDLISILPALTLLSGGFKLFRLFRIFRTFRVFRVFKALRYSKSIIIIVNVMKNTKDALLAVCTFAIGYIFVSALIIFNVESDSFATFFDAVYWATISLTTVGYGDIYPVTTAGIITAGYMNALREENNDGNDD